MQASKTAEPNAEEERKERSMAFGLEINLQDLRYP
jgi:hypothetical protein